MGHQCRAVEHLRSALSCAGQWIPDIVFLDVMLPEGDGIEHIPALLENGAGMSVVVLSSHTEGRYIQSAFAAGAVDYMVKPLGKGRFEAVVENLMRLKRKTASIPEFDRCGIVGESSSIDRCIDQLGLAARSEGNVIITGETGTGKELFAQALHRNSSRSSNRYVVVDCTNLPETLAESLLFGHSRGAFTGADRSKKGLFELAHNGTLFLDEVGDLSMSVQKSLLRVLQEKSFRPLSSADEVKVDFRLVAATNCDLAEMVEKGTFRRDLYYRLNMFSIDLPPLRDRNGDVELLTAHYVEHLCRDAGREPLRVGDRFLEALLHYDWPGNVREFMNVIRVSVFKAMFEDQLNYFHLPQNIRMHTVMAEAEDKGNNGGFKQAELFGPEPQPMQDLPDLKQYRRDIIDRMELEYLHHLVAVSKCSVKRACDISGLSRTRLYELLSKHSISLRT